MREYPLIIKNNKNQNLFAVMHQPSSKAPFVIFCHGFTSNKLGSYNIFVELSRRLCAKGIGSIRFDFAGSGDSEGKFEDISISQEMEDLKAVYSYMVSQDFVSSVALLGHSLGGLITALFIAEKPLPAVLLAPSIDRRKSMERDTARGKVNLFKDYFVRDGWKVNNSFIKEGAIELYSIANKIRHPVLIVQGTADESCSYENAVKFFEMLECKKKFAKIEGCDHKFTSLEHRERMFDASVEWLKEELK